MRRKSFLLCCSFLLACMAYGQQTEQDEVYHILKDKPLFQGANNLEESSGLFNEYLNQKIEQDSTLDQGSVHLRFVVDEKGQAGEVSIIGASKQKLASVAEQYILDTPLWKAAKHKGEKVKFLFTIRIHFDEVPANDIKL